MISFMSLEANIRIVLYGFDSDAINHSAKTEKNTGWEKLDATNILICLNAKQNFTTLVYSCLNAGGISAKEIIKWWRFFGAWYEPPTDTTGIIKLLVNYKNEEITNYDETKDWECPALAKEKQINLDLITLKLMYAKSYINLPWYKSWFFPGRLATALNDDQTDSLTNALPIYQAFFNSNRFQHWIFSGLYNFAQLPFTSACKLVHDAGLLTGEAAEDNFNSLIKHAEPEEVVSAMKKLQN